MPAEASHDPELFDAIFEAPTGRRASERDLVRNLSDADVVFVGEQHDDPLTHQVELKLLTELHRKIGDRLTLAMEMFERDGQPALDDYLAGRIEEPTLGKRVALWSNYATDYRPMIEFAKANHIPVVASNAPQRIVRQVGRESLATTLTALPAADRVLIADSIIVPEGDDYARRFAAVINEGHGDGKGMDAAMIRRFFEAQCVRDTTMAESVARQIDANRFVLHINGGFHSDAGLGTVQRLLWRRPLRTRVSVVKVVPYRDKFDVAADRVEANWAIYVPDTRGVKKEG